MKPSFSSLHQRLSLLSLQNMSTTLVLLRSKLSVLIRIGTMPQTTAFIRTGLTLPTTISKGLSDHTLEGARYVVSKVIQQGAALNCNSTSSPHSRLSCLHHSIRNQLGTRELTWLLPLLSSCGFSTPVRRTTSPRI